MYARAECRNGRWCGEPLVEHLLNVANIARNLAVRLGWERYAKEAYLAGLLHDIGKALYQRPCRGEGDRLSFKGHEVISYLLIVNCYSYRCINTDLEIVGRAVALHHQGLRGINLSAIEIDSTVENIIRKGDIKPLEELIKELARKVDNNIIERDEVERLVEHVNKIGVTKREAIWRSNTAGRAITAILMLADNYVATMAVRSACGGNKIQSKYEEEVLEFVRYIINNIPIIK
jgi:CRISPR-associated endonuclease Cas3-HD